jgi:low affinity Fe/Cu permease
MNDHSSLATRYLSARKEYDSQVITLGIERREVRCRRQTIADREFRVLNRRRVLQLQEADFEADLSQKMEMLEHEILSLRNRLGNVLAALKCEMAKLKPISPKQFSRLDQEYLISCLRDGQHQLQELDRRILSARRVLAEPTDLQLNEMFLEEDSEHTDHKFRALPSPSAEELERSVEKLEEENRERKCRLYRQCALLPQAKVVVSEGQKISVPDLQKRFTTYGAEDAKLPNNENMQSLIDDMVRTCAARQQKVALEEKRTDLVESQNREKRRQLKEEWELKITHVQKMKGWLRNREKLILAIDSAVEAIESDEMTYGSVRRNKKHINY